MNSKNSGLEVIRVVIMKSKKYLVESFDKHDKGSVFDTDNLTGNTLVGNIFSRMNWADLYEAET